MQAEDSLDTPQAEPTESAFNRATKVLSEIRREAEAHAGHGPATPGPDSDSVTPADQEESAASSQIIEALSNRLTALEQTIASLTSYVLQANHSATQGLEANHLAKELQSQMEVLVSRIEMIEASVRRLEQRVVDVDRMAAAVWDQTAIARRLARLEDVLARKDGSLGD